MLWYRAKIAYNNVIQDTEQRFEEEKKPVTCHKLGQFPVTFKSISIVTTMYCQHCSVSLCHASNQILYSDLWYPLPFMLQRLTELVQ